MMRKPVDLSVLLALAILTISVGARAAEPPNTPLIGLLYGGSSSSSMYVASVKAFREGLLALGYTEGQNIVIDYRPSGENLRRLPDLAVELVRRKADIIVTAGTDAARAAMEATKTIPIPIVMAGSSDPVGDGLVKSLRQPGGYVTGLTTMNAELIGKRIELLKEVCPSLSRVGVLGLAGYSTTSRSWKIAEEASQALGAQVLFLPVRGLDELAGVFATAKKERVGAVAMLTGTPFSSTFSKPIADLAVKNRLPVISPFPAFPRDGGLMSYGVSNPELYRLAAGYVDRILQGAKPADMPVEQPTKFDLRFNSKTAKALGLTISPSLLMRADEVIQ